MTMLKEFSYNQYRKQIVRWIVTHRSSSNQTVILSSDTRLKPFDEVPTKKSIIPSPLRLILSGGPAFLHEHCDRLHEELGPIYRDKLGPLEIVFLADTKLIQKVIANEGQYPHHNVPPAWTFYNQVHKIKRGLFFQTGKSWAKLRKAFNKVMLADPQSIYRHSPNIYQINRDLIQTWLETGEKNKSQILIKDVKSELCRWSVEATCSMLFDTRIGCINKISDGDNNGPQVQELIDHITQMFSETSHFQILPVGLAHRFGLPVWNRFEFATSNMLRIANDLAVENISKARKTSGESIVHDLLSSKALSDDEISHSVVDLIIAAADTTSSSLQWMLYLLAKHQDIQEKIWEEVKSLPADANESDPNQERIPLIKAFIKEALRLYPTAPFLARTLDKDITLSGYKIPSGKLFVFSLYTTSRMEKYFSQPLEFKPERWLRVSGADGLCRRDKYAYASLPFGVGARMCIGRRAAEFEMSSFIITLLKNFRCSLAESGDLKVKLKMILCPDRQINLLLKARHHSGS